MHRKNIQNSIRGLKTKKTGALYEKIFKGVCERQGASVIRIEDGARVIPLPQLRQQSHQKGVVGQVIRVRQPFDFIINIKGFIIACDVKTTTKTSLSYSYIHNTLLKPHQTEALLKLRSGCMSGMFTFFLEEQVAVFFDIKTILDLKPRNSLNRNHGYYLGPEQNFDLKNLTKISV